MKHLLLLPPRISLYVSRNQGRILKLILMMLIFITAMYTKEYKGEHQFLINSHIGGIFYVLFGSLLFSLVLPRLRPWQSTLLALGCTSLIECVQYFRFPFLLELTRTRFFLYLLGNSFNGIDFVYYVVGAVVGLTVLALVNHNGTVTGES
jgi:hypothetical protein